MGVRKLRFLLLYYLFILILFHLISCSHISHLIFYILYLSWNHTLPYLTIFFFSITTVLPCREIPAPLFPAL